MSAQGRPLGRWAAITLGLAQGLAPVLAWYRAQPVRERRLWVAGCSVLLGLLVWTLVLGPPLRLLRQAPAQMARLGADLAEMQALAAEAQQLRALPVPTAVDRQSAVAAALARLAPDARLSWQGPLAIVELAPVTGEQLVQLLETLRDEAGARVVEAQMQQSASGHWAGGVALALPALPPR